MTPLHRRTEDMLTELARIECMLVQGYGGAALCARLRAAREEAEAIARDGGIIPTGPVPVHWLDQAAAPSVAGVVSLASYRAKLGGAPTVRP